MSEWDEVGDFEVARDAFIEDFKKCISEVAPQGWVPGVNSFVQYMGRSSWHPAGGLEVGWWLTFRGIHAFCLVIDIDKSGCFERVKCMFSDSSTPVVPPPQGGLLQGWPEFSRYFKTLSVVAHAVRQYGVMPVRLGPGVSR